MGKWAAEHAPGGKGKLTHVIKKRKADGGAVEVELALCAGDLCMSKKFRVTKSLEVRNAVCAVGSFFH